MSLIGCNNYLFTMQCDVFYATEEQDRFGGMEKDWQLDRTEKCTLYSIDINDNSKRDKWEFDDSKFYRLQTFVYGRTATDLRRSSAGEYYPLSSILVTNIRTAKVNAENLFIETDGDYAGQPIVFEVKILQPFVGVTNSIEYYKVQLERSDYQVVNESVLCQN